MPPTMSAFGGKADRNQLPSERPLIATTGLKTARVPGASSTTCTRRPLATAIRYTLARWASLTRFVDDGRIEIDTNTVERTMRPIALGRKNHLFAGSDGGARTWATIASLIQSAKLNDVEPYAYLCDILERMVQGHPINRIDDLLPWKYASTLAKAA